MYFLSNIGLAWRFLQYISSYISFTVFLWLEHLTDFHPLGMKSTVNMTCITQSAWNSCLEAALELQAWHNIFSFSISAV